MKAILYTLFLLLINLHVFSQQKEPANLKVGDTIPDIEIPYQINGVKKTINTRTMRGKFVILDFWNIWCGSCISAMPEMDRLNKQFTKDVQIFLVTDNTQKQVDELFAKIASRSVKGTPTPKVPSSISSVIGDKVLHQLFPHIGVPHHVWIDRNGRIIHIAFGTDTNEQTLKSLVIGRSLDIIEKKDIKPFDFETPLYKEGNGRQLERLKYYSMVYSETSEHTNTHVTKQMDSLNQIYRFRCLNFTIRELFLRAVPPKYASMVVSRKRTILEVADSSKLFWPNDHSKVSQWRINNLYSYDLAVPLNQKDSTSYFMMRDLMRYLPYTANFEKRQVKCLALVEIDNKRRFAEKADLPYKRRTEKDGSLSFQASTIDEFLYQGLSKINSSTKLPVVDDTHYLGKITLRLSNPKDPEQIRKDLKSYGLELQEKIVELEMFVIKDK